MDPDILVAGLLTPWGTCGQVVQMLTSGEIDLCADARILLEYDDVLHRPRFGIDPQRADTLLHYLREEAVVYPAVPLSARLPDPDEEAFLEVAIAANAECLATGNEKRFPPECAQGIRVSSPAEFLDSLRGSRTE